MSFQRHHWRHDRRGDDALIASDLPEHAHTSTDTGGDYAWADITGFGTEPAAVSSSTSGTAGTATTVSRGDHGHDLSTHAHSGATDGGQIAYSALTGALTQAAGTYTPTLTNVANLDASTAYVCQYLRVGSVVTVSGVVDVDPTLTATATRLGISLPVVSDFASDVQCGGVAAAIAAASESAGIYADATNNRAELRWICGVTANTSLRFTFTYLVV